MPPPNILYLHTHDTGRYVQPYVPAIPTPHIQRVAGQGTVFRNAHSGSPTCSPSRAGLLTGQAAHSCGMFGLVNRGFTLRDPHKLVTRPLRAAGYTTVQAGVTHIVRDLADLGYDRILPTRDSALATAEAAAGFLRDTPAQPFFLDVGFYPTHRPFPEPAPADQLAGTAPPPPLPDTPDTRRDVAAFKASARQLDACVGTVMQALDDAGLAAGTLVILTTDHGIAFPMMKCNLTSHGTGVMLIMRGPGVKAGGSTAALVSQLDIVPTLCDVAGIPPPPWLQGVSLKPLLDGTRDAVRAELFAEVNFHCAYEPMRAVRTPAWLYVRRFHDFPTPVTANCDASPTKDDMLRHGWRDRLVPREELFDLARDPLEMHNLAGDPAHAGTQRALHQRLETWMRETADPLLAGPLSPPPGARVNDPGDREPHHIGKPR